MAAETALTFPLVRLRVLRILHSGAIDVGVLLALDLKSRIIASGVDGIAASPAVLWQIELSSAHKWVGVATADTLSVPPDSGRSLLAT